MLVENRTKILVSSIRKLYHRSATKNIRRILVKTHTADIAALLSELEQEERIQVFQLIDDVNQKSEVFSYLDNKFQKELIDLLGSDDVQKLVSNMESDDAADLLASLPDTHSQEILESMHTEDSEEVKDLLKYSEDSAGGLMNTDYVAIDQNLSVKDSIIEIQSRGDENLVCFYIYVVDEKGHLVGIVSLKDLILSKPHLLLKNIMIDDVISVNPEMHQEDVAKIVERYDFLSVPVVDEQNILLGIVTVDDVIDVIRAEGADDLHAMGGAAGGESQNWLERFKSRFPLLVFSFVGGLFSYFIVKQVAVGIWEESLLMLLASIPLLLAVVGTCGGQALSVAVAATSTQNTVGFWRYIADETLIATVFTFIFAGLSYVSIKWIFLAPAFAPVLALSLAILIIFTSLLGASLPFLLKYFKIDTSIASIPLITIVSDLLAILVLFRLNHYFSFIS